jgi:hypothetical protein
MTLQTFARTWKSVAAWLLIAASLTVAGACGAEGDGPGAPGNGTGTGATPTPTPAGPMVSQPAPIHEVSLSESVTKPGVWVLHVQYGLPSGCARPGGYQLMESFPHQVQVNILQPADSNMACTMIYGYATYDIELGGGYEACKSYDIRINGEPHRVPAISPVALCAPEAEVEPQLPTGYIAEQAPIESVGLIGSENTPTQWTLQVVYGLKNGCVRPGSYATTQSIPPQYIVNAFVPSDPNTVCTAIYGTASAEIPVTGGYEACKVYLFHMNGKDYRAQAITPLVRCQDPASLPVSTPGPVSGPVSGGIISGYDALLYSLQSLGLTVERAKPHEGGFFEFPPAVMLVNGEAVQVYEFPSVAAADSAKGRVSPDGGSYSQPGGPVVSVMWVAPPHFYLLANTISIYVGTDSDVLQALSNVATQFAGQGSDSAPLPRPASTPFLPPGTPGPAPVPTPIGSDGPQISVDAPVEIFELIISKSLPPQYAVRVVTSQRNGCVELDGYSVKRAGDLVEVRMTNSEPFSKDVVCTQLFKTTETVVDLGTDFQRGVEYTLRVNGKDQKFTAQ